MRDQEQSSFDLLEDNISNLEKSFERLEKTIYSEEFKNIITQKSTAESLSVEIPNKQDQPNH